MAADMSSIEASVAFSLSEDKMSAYLQIIEADDHTFFTVEALEQLLKSNGVNYGVNTDALNKLATDPKMFLASTVKVAQGKPAINGEDGSVHFLFDLGNETTGPAELEDGKVDYREIRKLNNAAKGQLIAERLPPTKGIPGMNVLGEAVAAKDGREARIMIGRNVVTDPERNRLYAVIDGLITLTERGKINVFPVYEVNGDVDYRTGNIDFIGTVVIRGNVLTGFRVKAAGDIRVTGGVEGAELEADGSIDIAAGIVAANKGKVIAGVNVKSSFVQEANITAGEDVIVSQSIMHSHVRAGRGVYCKGAKGLIVGGVIQAGEKIEVRTVGNTMSTPTSLEVGVSPELRNELLQLRQSIKSITENIDKTDKALNLLNGMAAAGTLTPDKLEMRTKLMHSKKASVDELANVRDRILEIEAALEMIDKAQVDVINTIYAGSKVVIGRYTRFIKDSTTRVQFFLQNGDISLTSHF
ncbi:DUF342 domain-containing protein [Paenibacillus thermotolerans]|uniref:DUF342 domain-containing protein n=1 Tax=Paenibacillus thermotolerans TaxID=3027807 RepID=UPI0023687EF7|nr:MULTISPECIES: FapA family protein [unclassified Paenibacillus]